MKPLSFLVSRIEEAATAARLSGAKPASGLLPIFRPSSNNTRPVHQHYDTDLSCQL